MAAQDRVLAGRNGYDQAVDVRVGSAPSDDSLSVTLASDEGSLAVVGSVTISATPSITVKRAAISAASSGDNTLIAAVVGSKIKVLGVVLIAAGAVNVRFESGAGGTALTGVMSMAAAGNGFVVPIALPGYHHFETAVNTLLNLELSAAVQVSGWLVYYEEA